MDATCTDTGDIAGGTISTVGDPIMGIPGIRIEQNRVKLADQIPLRTPYSVTIVPSSYCNLTCQFCPNRMMGNKHIMSLDKFKGIIDNAGFRDKVKMLHLYNVGEPLMNPNLPSMIAYAKEKEFSERISFVTNASLMDRRAAKAVILAGVDRIIISLYGLSDADYLENTNRRVSFAEVYENIKYLNSIKGDCKIYVKVIDRAVDNPDKLWDFAMMFKNHCDYYSMEPVLPIWPNFKPEGEDEGARGLYEGIPAKERLACHYPFYSMVVNARGFVNLCLADWNETVELGDTAESSLNCIWNSDRYYQFRLMQLRGERLGSGLCATCGTLRVATAQEDDIDEDRERLLKEFGG